MNPRSRRLLTPLVALLAVGAIALGVGRMTLRTPVAPVVAIVDIQKVLTSLNEHKDKQAAFKKNVDELRAKAEALDNERTADETKIKNLADGPAKIKALKDYRDKYFRAGVEREYGGRLMAEDEVNILRDLYLKIDDAATRLAKQNGYHMVLSSDERIEIPGAPRANIEELSQTIRLKRMLYIDPALDISDDLIAFMNNEYAVAPKN